MLLLPTTFEYVASRVLACPIMRPTAALLGASPVQSTRDNWEVFALVTPCNYGLSLVLSLSESSYCIARIKQPLEDAHPNIQLRFCLHWCAVKWMDPLLGKAVNSCKGTGLTEPSRQTSSGKQFALTFVKKQLSWKDTWTGYSYSTVVYYDALLCHFFR
jgi:hypothetical protein